MSLPIPNPEDTSGAQLEPSEEQAVPLNGNNGMALEILVDIHPPSAPPTRINQTTEHLFTLVPGKEGLQVTIEPPAEIATPEARREGTSKLTADRSIPEYRFKTGRAMQSWVTDRRQSQRPQIISKVASRSSTIPKDQYESQTLGNIILQPGDKWGMKADEPVEIAGNILGIMRGFAKVVRAEKEPQIEETSNDSLDMDEFLEKGFIRIRLGDGDFLEVKRHGENSDEVTVRRVHRGVVYSVATNSVDYAKEHKTVASLVAAGIGLGLGLVALKVHKKSK